MAIAAFPVVWHLLHLDLDAMAWSNDTASHVTFQPFRQPGYGIFFRSLTALGLSEPGIAVVQGLLFAFALCFLAWETSRTRMPLGLAILLLLIWWFPLNTGLAALATSFMSEALFLPLILTACGLALRARRTGNGWNLVGATAGVSACIFVREAALSLLPAMVLVWLLGLALGERSLKITAATALASVAILTGLIPLLLGRGAWSVRPPVDRNDSVFISRVVMLPANLDVQETRRILWNRLNRSFIACGKNLTCSGRSLYEGQLQEAVRYYLGPKILLADPALAAPESAGAGNAGMAGPSGFALFKDAVRQAPLEYAVSSGCHLWATLTAGTHIGTKARLAVFQALQSVDPETWQIAKFRTDYPLLHFDVPLKKHTEYAYLGFRLFASAGTLAGMIACAGLLLASVGRKALLDASGTA